MENSHPSRPSAGSRRALQTWQPHRLLFFYRLTLVLTLSAVYFSGLGPSLLGSSSPDLFEATIAVYLVLVVVSGFFLYWRSPPPAQQVQFNLLIDIFAITMLMHASGGITSGLGLLIAVSIANGSLLMSSRLALLFASLAVLAVLAEQLYAQMKEIFPTTAYTQVGILGIAFFAVAIMAHGLSRRVQETERLAQQRGLDLANMAQLNEYIIRHMNTGVLVVERNSTIRLMNETAGHLLGLQKTRIDEPLNTVLPELALLVDDWRRDQQTTVSAFQPQPGAKELKLEFTPLSADAGVLIILEDTARVSAQAQQLKLASLGRLTASIAHEIRNPLGAMSHAGQLLAESPELNRGDRRLTQIIKDNSTRVNDVIETVLQLSRRDRVQMEYLRLSTWTEHFVDDFCRTRLVDPERFHVQIAPADFLVQADPRQLQQILGNLCDNGLKFAAGSKTPPRIRLEGGLELEGRYPLLDVIDNGPGIPPENAGQIFEPFFTTGTKGTGLGLYIVKGLCDINHIEIEYLSNPGGGSCFRLGFRSWKIHNQKG